MLMLKFTTGGGVEDENWTRQASMDEYIGHLFVSLREALEKAFKMITAGNWADDGKYSSFLARYMASPQAFEWHNRLKRDLAGYEM
jgi:hypothetical protein